MPTPDKPRPAWAAADFQCGDEPVAPDKVTTKAKVEAYIADLLGLARTCKTKLDARGADAKRYEMIGTK